MLNISICEDEKIQADELEKMIKEKLNSINIDYSIQKFSSGEELLSGYKDTDIIFLDIKMSKLSGMDTARKIRKIDKNVEIIFTTALQEYVFEAYEVRAFRYLLKPIDKELLFNYLELCINELNSKNKKICLKNKSDMIVLNTDDILYVEVIRKEITIYTESEKYSIKMSLKSLEDMLNGKNFFKCHNSYLINLDKISHIDQHFATIKDFKIPISRPKYKEFKIALASHLGDFLC